VTRPLEPSGHVGRKYGIPQSRYKRITPQLLRQVRACKTEAARRLILGVSRKITEPESASQ
jgi:hypothetical protein